MIFFRRLGVAELIELCSALKFGLRVGIVLPEVMNLLANRGTRRVRALAEEMRKKLISGWSFQDTLARQQHALPPLFISMATVGEEGRGGPPASAHPTLGLTGVRISNSPDRDA
jgi:type II secretory pathway component PulF